MLASLVSAGTLPPLEQRLPEKADVMVEPVVDEIGRYGGNWTMAWTGPGDKWAVGQPSEEALFRFNKEGSGIEPNVAKNYEVNEDSTEFTIHLRKGMKWSDGVPFTADDVLFYWEHMLTKETFGKKIYDAYYSVDPDTGEKALATVTKVDDYTFKVVHKYPSVQFLERVAIDNKWFFAPAHFHKTILPEFVGEAEGAGDRQAMGLRGHDLLPQRDRLLLLAVPADSNLAPMGGQERPQRRSVRHGTQSVLLEDGCGRQAASLHG